MRSAAHIVPFGALRCAFVLAAFEESAMGKMRFQLSLAPYGGG